ncbi:hypothetical protein [Indioceanicola profundi]|uniref:hypothetical protein n=1 Tax=Indioceanicola profundi TaxID=2220096 RepID=UPI000E6AA89B|nr:hypothetical protein [Indioceanicola profundi]
MQVTRRHGRQDVRIGQRFRKTGAGVWEVVGMSRDGMGHQHVRLRRVADPNTEKTIAMAMLYNAREFQPEPVEE